MEQGFLAWLDAQQGRQYELHERHINPAFVKMIRTIGFDKEYVRGQGSWLFDAQGNRYLDLLTGWGVFALGRNHPRVRSILEQVLARDMPNLVRMDCSLLSGLVAERLTRLACTYSGGGLTRVFFCNSGTESVEAAIKFARCYTRKTRILYCDHAFHGLTVGSLSLNGSEFFRERFGSLMPGTAKIPFNDLTALEQALHDKDVAAFIVEPVQGKTCEVVGDGYLAEAARLCHKAGALLVADEVQSGLGRTGKWFAYQHWPEVEPDIVCVSKALSGGYVPVGAVIAQARIMDAVFDSMEHCVIHSNTFGQNDLAMAAALATLMAMEEDNVAANAARLGAKAIARLAEMGKTCPFFAEVRGKGLMFGIDFRRPEGPVKLKAAWDALHLLNEGVFSQTVIMPLMHEHRILAQVAGYHTELIKFLPPLNIAEEDLDVFLNAMESVLAGLGNIRGSAWKTVRKLTRGAAAEFVR
ncbi:MAG TPA: aspartate aminotransferase family protein [Bryobacteraceae bacterium]|jgi:ornithine--oxo-acid transaminase|nr:aspartate aminotransferase family protein [Bryobacteraceae bacterium]